ncbi:uncharacterized protein MONBRDRAFT_5431 [Monosiga brevicollis MX1]|uniref:TRAF-type domain-containing protein n=1 Tax=Monosiga brevicollis TaxID=81824 RepID=A9UQY9_MONBE|nr:uncharacterized protein MONBRDRAFT_5431 [Monosiga brevicollis MX1]EDQ92682.1 predicted protein [Monosiga brevicollis MX1]|eukprot:XP_001742444.1 hypothetical protein [Monosiga brevicollis MX1]
MAALTAELPTAVHDPLETACWESTRFVDDVSPHLRCPICLNVCLNPVACSTCDQVFGEHCWYQALAAHGCCPTCRQKEHPFASPSRLARSFIGDYRVRCRHASEGCTEVLPLQEMLKHQAVCGHLQRPCPHCQVPVRASDAQQHEDECALRLVMCPHVGCGIQVPMHALAEHRGRCIHPRPSAGDQGTRPEAQHCCQFCHEHCSLATAMDTWCRPFLEHRLALAQLYLRRLQTAGEQQAALIKRSTTASRDLSNALRDATGALGYQTSQLRQQQETIRSVGATRDHAVKLLRESETMRKTMSDVLRQKNICIQQLKAENELLRRKMDTQDVLLKVLMESPTRSGRRVGSANGVQADSAAEAMELDEASGDKPKTD